MVVSAAAGAVGSVAGQLAKRDGARVVGIAGGPEKCSILTEKLGFDAAVDHRAEDWRKRLKAATPDSIDVDFENVGGEIMDAIFARLNLHARIALCGLISGYNDSARHPAGARPSATCWSSAPPCRASSSSTTTPSWRRSRRSWRSGSPTAASSRWRPSSRASRSCRARSTCSSTAPIGKARRTCRRLGRIRLSRARFRRWFEPSRAHRTSLCRAKNQGVVLTPFKIWLYSSNRKTKRLA